MSACKTCARILLIILNVLFLIIGIILAIIGGILKWSPSTIVGLVQNQIVPLMQTYGGAQEVAQTVGRLTEALAPFGLVIFVAGLIILVLCALGLFGAICKSRILLIVYLILHGILIIGEITVVIIYSVKQNILTDPLKETVENTMANYVSYDAQDSDSMVAKALMFALQCCGSNDGGDFAHSTKFKSSVSFKGSSYTLSHPIPCCKFDQSNNPMGNCPTTFDSTNSNIDRGCWTILKGYIDQYGMYAVYVAIGVILLQVILEVASIVMVCSKGL